MQVCNTHFVAHWKFSPFSRFLAFHHPGFLRFLRLFAAIPPPTGQLIAAKKRKRRKRQRRACNPHFVAHRKFGAFSRFLTFHHPGFLRFLRLFAAIPPATGQLIAAKKRKRRKRWQRRRNPQFVAPRIFSVFSRIVALHHSAFCVFCAFSRLFLPRQAN